ncbi:MAG: PQQ-binding-like beta-propeller repeat protein [Bryobacterales bacterium]
MARRSIHSLQTKTARVWLALALLIPAVALCANWPQFLGPNRDGVYPGDDIVDAFPGGGPEVVWEKNVGAGFSNPVVANGRLILFHRLGGKEVVEALDAETGKPVWKFEYATAYRDDFGFDEGPRAAPVVSGGQVYTFGAEGMLHCLQFAGGSKIWSLDTHKEFGVSKGFFGAAGSPLVEGQRIFLNVGGGGGAGLVALDKDTGRVLWKATGQGASYASPILASFGGKPHLLAFTRAGLVGADPATGEIYFEFPWRARSNASVNAATPLVVDDLIFLSASYGTGAVLLRVKGTQLEKIWSGEDSLTNHYSTSVYHDGHLYGYHGRQEHGQSFRAIELRTGKLRWSEERFGAGTVTRAGNRLLLMRENGELMMIRATPERFEVISRAQILPGTVRAYPALADGLFYARSEKTLVCVKLRK